MHESEDTPVRCDRKDSGLPQQSHLMSWLGQPLADLKAVLTKLPLILIAPMYACPLSVIP